VRSAELAPIRPFPPYSSLKLPRYGPCCSSVSRCRRPSGQSAPSVRRKHDNQQRAAEDRLVARQ
jgi:hypothetical protein